VREEDADVTVNAFSVLIQTFQNYARVKRIRNGEKGNLAGASIKEVGVNTNVFSVLIRTFLNYARVKHIRNDEKRNLAGA